MSFTLIRLPATVTALAACLALNAGCDDGDSPDADGSSGAIETPAAFWSRLAAASCGKLFECCPGGDETFPDEATCNAAVAGFLSMGNEPVDQGWARFDPANATACMAILEDALAASACGGELASPADADAEACDAIFVGLQGEGDPCGEDLGDGATALYDTACATGLKCSRVDGMDLPACITVIADGAACPPDSDACSDDSYCKVDGETGVCTPRAAVGEPCDSFEACDDDGFCQDGACAAFEDDGDGDMCGPA